LIRSERLITGNSNGATAGNETTESGQQGAGNNSVNWSTVMNGQQWQLGNNNGTIATEQQQVSNSNGMSNWSTA